MGSLGNVEILSREVRRSSELIGTLTTFSFEPKHQFLGRRCIFAKMMFLLQRTASSSDSLRSSGIDSMERPFFAASGGSLLAFKYLWHVPQRYVLGNFSFSFVFKSSKISGLIFDLGFETSTTLLLNHNLQHDAQG